ncbi:G1 family glutamic endopeptidase [Companilactobacillus sp. HBUAS56275]|uniref:G1 family glutamic endopeptidase n=1 Tax=Companilactobacillus sp. HBUAS56275 TaxID=3109364 RepID=UPI002FEF283B
MKTKGIRQIVWTILLFLVAVFGATSIQNVKAAEINDGIDNWYAPSGQMTQVGLLPMGDNLDLGYTFGLAQSYNSNTSQLPYFLNGGDDSIVKDSYASGNSIQYSKMDVFLKKGDKYVNALFQNRAGTNVETNRSLASSLSPDFMIVPSDSTTTKVTAAEYSVLPSQFAGTDPTNRLSNKKYYVGTDANGNPAYKIVGDLKRNSKTYGVFDLKIELLMRADPNNSAIVQREMYVYNSSSTTQKFTTMFAEDTALGLMGKTDQSYIYDMGEKRGLIITSRADSTDKYTLLITNKVKDGFDQYTGVAKDLLTTPTNWLDGFKNSKNQSSIDGAGAEEAGNPYGTSLFKTSDGSARVVDTAYALKWNPTTLAPGETAHFVSTMGAMPQSAASPEVSKTYTNKTDSTGKNEVGDRLKFTMKVTNNGYGSQWSYDKLVDEIPEGLQIDTSTIRKSQNNGDFTEVPASSYDDSSRTLTVMPGYSLKDNEYATITFEAIVESGAGTTIKNTAQFFGTDQKVTGATQQKYQASVDVPIEKLNFDYKFTRQVKNESNNETDYADQTTAKVGDILSYRTKFEVTNNSTHSLASATNLISNLPDSLGTPYDTYVTGADGNGYYQNGTSTGLVKEVKAGESVTVENKAKVTSAAVGKITTNATLKGGISANKDLGDLISNNAEVSIENVDGITSVPNLIDFGTHNFSGSSIETNNVKTDGELIVNHPTNNPFMISVSYDNDDPDSRMKNNNGDTLSNNLENILFFRQRQTSVTDSGTWQPILPNGTRIQSADFSGGQDNLDLSEYIGAGSWKLKMDSGTKSGSYSGTITWQMVDSE